jgi:hypothetical protein
MNKEILHNSHMYVNCFFQPIISYTQNKPDGFRVIAFYTGRRTGSYQFLHKPTDGFRRAAENNFTYDSTNNWNNLTWNSVPIPVVTG